ncbi:MAG TPA: hypothetical protein VKA34_19720 [Balneolales bacterium]|nr:hypothetical protein [Balneolales bacterium]
MTRTIEDYAKPFFCPIDAFSRFRNPPIWLICCGSEVAQALTLNKNQGFAKPSFNNIVSK